MKKTVILFLIVLFISVYTCFLTYWSGSYVVLDPNWQEQTVLTPESVQDPRDIYVIDKWIYAFKMYPVRSITFLLSASGVIGFCTYFVRKFIRKRKNGNTLF
ncbi:MULTISPECIES: DUF4306 domain-containing protein [Virgibacillus]|uniref:DUF4306 domain-containing protein n=1 Tax=Virgibacillus dokdonensis TaxID=302167 RepID=A0A2K9IYS6_9BACI|nr:MULTISPECIES: DUF4306 domain-containing protein [Virgibacillus]AUJ24882.1 hypothetical protein A21D_01801 [Virgibacillus dokdonensis]NWO13795.1 DUF4306 domain-containing protein [Virgibacillus sp.]